MKRRDLIAGLCGAIAWPLAARAQQKAMPVVGSLHPTSPEIAAAVNAKFNEGLREAGYTEGQNVAFEHRYAEGHADRLPALAAELVARNVDVIVTGGWLAAQAARKATSRIPIVAGVGVDPVATGLVSDLARPEGNLTGVTVFGPRLTVKRLELLSELVPEARVMAILQNLNNAVAVKTIEQYGPAADETARAKGIKLHRVSAGNPAEIDTAFATLAELKVGGLMVGVDPLFYYRKDQIVALAARYRIPTIYDDRMYTDAGGLISYGAKDGEIERLTAAYVGRIFAGAKPADLPFQMTTKFALVINRKTANTLGLTIPVELETLAEEIVE